MLGQIQKLSEKENTVFERLKKADAVRRSPESQGG